MEIERKFLVLHLPKDLGDYPHDTIEQGYLCTDPVVRVRRQVESYALTYKGPGLMVREEYNLPLTREGYEHLLPKTDGIVIRKTRYVLPEEGGLSIELDLFHGEYEGLALAEVEFPSREEAEAYQPRPWMGEDVTMSGKYHNSVMSRAKNQEPSGA